MRPFDSNAFYSQLSLISLAACDSALQSISHIDKNGKLYHFCASGCESAFKDSVKLTNKEHFAQNRSRIGET